MSSLPVSHITLTGVRVAHRTDISADASVTGKGLLFWSKDHYNKSTPSGIIDLAAALSIEVIDSPSRVLIAFPGLHGWTLRANHVRADSAEWQELLDKKRAEALELRSSLKDDETYSSNLQALKNGSAFLKKPSPADVEAVLSGDEDATGVQQSSIDNAAGSATSPTVERSAEAAAPVAPQRGVKEKRKSLTASFSMVLDRLKSPSTE